MLKWLYSFDLLHSKWIQLSDDTNAASPINLAPSKRRKILGYYFPEDHFLRNKDDLIPQVCSFTERGNLSWVYNRAAENFFGVNCLETNAEYLQSTFGYAFSL